MDSKNLRCKYYSPSGTRCKNEFPANTDGRKRERFCKEHRPGGIHGLATSSDSSRSKMPPEYEKGSAVKPNRSSAWKNFDQKADDSANNASMIFGIFMIANIIGGFLLVFNRDVKAHGLQRFFCALVIFEILSLLLIFYMWDSIQLRLSLQSKIELERAIEESES